MLLPQPEPVPPEHDPRRQDERVKKDVPEKDVSRNGQRKGQVGEVHLQTEENGAGQRQKEP
jgi:hypothetical protein